LIFSGAANSDGRLDAKSLAQSTPTFHMFFQTFSNQPSFSSISIFAS